MLKAWLSRCAIIFLSYSFIGLAHAYSESTKSDPLQTYRDEIKQSETNASQAVLNALKANADPENVTQQNQTVSPTAKPTRLVLLIGKSTDHRGLSNIVDVQSNPPFVVLAIAPVPSQTFALT